MCLNLTPDLLLDLTSHLLRGLRGFWGSQASEGTLGFWGHLLSSPLREQGSGLGRSQLL